MVAATCRQLLMDGLAQEAAVLAAGLYAAGHPHRSSHVVAAAAVDADDGGAAAAVAEAHVALWRAGALPLLRDMHLVAVRQGWQDAAAETAWRVMQRRGGQGQVAGVLAAMLRQGAAREAADLAHQLGAVSSGNHLVAEVRLSPLSSWPFSFFKTSRFGLC